MEKNPFVENRHTPGPWTNKGIGRDFVGNIAAKDREGAKEIALVVNPDSEEGRANGLLMAAAPDLFQALEALVLDRHIHEAGPRDICPRCETDIRSPYHFNAGESRKTDMGRAISALAKAKGA